MTLEPGQRFIGVDLAWSRRQPTGVAALAPAPGGLAVLASRTAGSDDDIVAFVAAHLGTATVVMVDAPLRVPNDSGNRACERLLNERFRAVEAGAHPSNRAHFARTCGGVRGEELVARLAALGVREAGLEAAGTGHVVYECYPHPAHVVLFGLERTLKYKRKSRKPADGARMRPEPRAEFERLLSYMGALRDPALLLDAGLLAELAPAGARGRAYKDREDRTDALFCAYLAALAPLGRLEMLGTVEDGHIVVPRGRARPS